MFATAQQPYRNQFSLKTHTHTHTHKSHIKCHVSQTVEERTVHLVHKMNINKSAKSYFNKIILASSDNEIYITGTFPNL
jgi:hypothetical protein